jgi:hypothetical protein
VTSLTNMVINEMVIILVTIVYILALHITVS